MSTGEKTDRMAKKKAKCQLGVPRAKERSRTAGDGGGGGEAVRTGKGGRWLQENKEKRSARPLERWLIGWW